jgi:hypothetical protein
MLRSSSRPRSTHRAVHASRACRARVAQRSNIDSRIRIFNVVVNNDAPPRFAACAAARVRLAARSPPIVAAPTTQ